MWIDPENSSHFLIGGDGGVYETFDEGAEYRFVSNLPVTQFYRIQTDNSIPFALPLPCVVFSYHGERSVSNEDPFL